MRILLISQEYPPETGWGGIGTYTYHLAHGLDRAGHRVEVISQAPDGRARVAKDGGVTVHRIANRHPYSALRRARLSSVAHILGWSRSVNEAVRLVAREAPPDVIEAPLWDAESLWYGLRPHSALVVRAETPRTEFARTNGLDRRRWALDLKMSSFLEGFAVRRATLVIAISRAVAKTVVADYRVRPDRIRIGYLGIPMPDPREESPPSKRVRFLFVGRLEVRKGIRHLLGAIPGVLAELPAAQFLIAGKEVPMPLTNKSYRSEFEEVAGAEAVAATTFLGYVTPGILEELYATCDVFVAPSLYESFGLVHLEAMAHGKPVVACRAGATPEIVQHGETGILVEPEDTAALADELIRLGRDREERRRLGRRGAEICRTTFTVEAMVEETVGVYKEAVRRWREAREQRVE
jgi:glycosyltransferase involved in cell wall biosynthesis